MQESIVLRTNRVSQIGAILTAQGGLPLLKVFAANPPLDCAAPDPGLLLCTMTLPTNPLASANGQATMLGTWSGVAANNGFAQCYRLYDSTPTCHVQGVCSEPWAPSLNYSLSQQISNANGVYDCASPGVSASVGVGPSGTGSGIVDGSVVWNFIAPAAEMVFASTNLAPGLSLPVQNFSITAANA
jgi:hypothetical protein